MVLDAAAADPFDDEAAAAEAAEADVEVDVDDDVVSLFVLFVEPSACDGILAAPTIDARPRSVRSSLVRTVAFLSF